MSRWHTTDFDLLPEGAFQTQGGRGKFGGKMTLHGGGKGGGAPAPDPRIAEAALRQTALNEKMFADYQTNDRPWMQQVSSRALGITEANAARAAELGDYQLGQMKRNDERWWNTAVPFENQLLSDVNRFDSKAYKGEQVASAKADVQEAFDNVQAQTSRGLARRGVAPGSGMALATAGMQDIGKATALATAANKTRMAADQIGLSSKMSMYGGMKGLAGLGNANAGMAVGAMGTGNQSAAGMTGAAGAYLGANNAALGAYNGGMNGALGTMNAYNSNQIKSAEVNMANDPMNTILGAAAGAGMAYATGGLSTMGKNASWAKG